MLGTQKAFYGFLIATLIIKLGFAYTLPITTDEAYFYIWGIAPDYGYYDHPPMVGWMFWLLQHVSHDIGWLRTVSVLLTTIIGFGIYKLISRNNPEMGALAGSLYMIMPVNLYGILISTDTTLVLWMFFSVVSFYLAVERESKGWFAMAGLFLALAVLSKYFSVLLGFAYLVYFLIFERNGRGFFKLFIVYLMVVPALAIQLVWNYDHCWGNYMFNFVNRHDRSSGFSLYTFFGYMLMWVYLLVPPIVYYLYKRRKDILSLREGPERVFLIAYFVPVLLFQALALVKVIGLHWVLGFYPFIFLIMAHVFDRKQFKTSIKVTLVVSLIHVAAFAAVIAKPMAFVEPGDRYYHEVVMGTQPEVFLDAIEEYRDDYSLATTSYSVAAVMTYHAGENVSVIGKGSSHARHDDIMTDFRKLDGRNILIFYEDRESVERFAPMFETVDSKEVTIEGASFYILLGQGFKYEDYRDTYLEQVKMYYQIPKLLPKGQCYFYDRYFPDEAY
ncbi:MAG: glycosyltransferase family 39 protein [Gammaproteobacteria bacterium]|nr:glycosyltransferase family 39 protein [Gammaproteobacteria bacterium]